MNEPITLTELETKCLEVFQKGMDCDNEGWLHEMDHKCPVQGKALSGVISSMVKKGIIHSFENDEVVDAYWIEVQDAYQK